MATLGNVSRYPSGYKDDYVASSILNVANGYAGADNTTYASISVPQTESATCKFEYTFDAAAIPENAVITEITCSARVCVYSNGAMYYSTAKAQMYSGTTAKGSTATIPLNRQTPAATSIPCGDWTRDELSDCRLRLTVTRRSTNYNKAVSIYFYGATLAISYGIPGTVPITRYVTIDGVQHALSGEKVVIDGVTRGVIEAYANVDGVWYPMQTLETPTVWKRYTLADETAYKLSTGGVTVDYYSESPDTCEENGCNLCGSSNLSISDYEDAWSGYDTYAYASLNESTGVVTFSGKDSSRMSGYDLISKAQPDASGVERFLTNVSSVAVNVQSVLGGTPADVAYYTYTTYYSGDDYAHICVSKYRVVRESYKTGNKVCGTYVDTVQSFDDSAYPDNGQQGDYWYIKQ